MKAVVVTRARALLRVNVRTNIRTSISYWTMSCVGGNCTIIKILSYGGNYNSVSYSCGDDVGYYSC